MAEQNYTDLDSQYIWHPFTQMKTALPNIPIVSAKNTILTDADGKTYIDAIASWWTNLHGHANPLIAEAITEQAKTLEHVIFAGFTHPKAIELSKILVESTPINQGKVFFSDNGSTAVEVAIKMAIQYSHQAKGIENPKLIAFKNAYHGDTFGAMSISERGAFTKAFHPKLFDTIYIDEPYIEIQDYSTILLQLEKALAQPEVVAFVYEPLLQGTAGMRTYNIEIFNQMLSLCKSAGKLLIADEVLTGFYRTGKPFASDYLTSKPDIMALSKGITGGFMPLGVTIASKEIFDGFYDDDKFKAFYHGHSYTANPLACAAAVASAQLTFSDNTQQRVENINTSHAEFKKIVEKHPKVENSRLLGTMLSLEVRTSNQGYFSNIRDKMYSYAIDRGVLLRPLGNTLYLLPPYCISEDELDKCYQVISEILDQIV
jgi:adenosylmethionine-8-amino-7-oxononanoate aminotransferase